MNTGSIAPHICIAGGLVEVTWLGVRTPTSHHWRKQWEEVESSGNYVFYQKYTDSVGRVIKTLIYWIETCIDESASWKLSELSDECMCVSGVIRLLLQRIQVALGFLNSGLNARIVQLLSNNYSLLHQIISQCCSSWQTLIVLIRWMHMCEWHYHVTATKNPDSPGLPGQGFKRKHYSMP